MRFVHAAAFLSVLSAFAGFAATPAGKATAPKKVAVAAKATAKGVASKAPATRVASKGVVAKGLVAKGPASKAKKTAAPVPSANWRTRQMSPGEDRYKEIQQALVTKGYLKTEPTGVWDADSVGAMQRFQMDQKLTPNGKINAPSLIGLGLGAKSAGAPEVPALPGAPPPTAPPPPAVPPTAVPPAPAQ